MSYHAGSHCKNLTHTTATCGRDECGTCVGPFLFVSGFLVIFSTLLASELHYSETMVDDVLRLSAASSLASHNRKERISILEDIWIGSVLERHQLARGSMSTPVSFVALSDGNDRSFVSDELGLLVG